MPSTASLTREGDLAILRIDNPPLNALSPRSIRDLAAALDAFEADSGAVALVLECAGRTFVAGGDITAFEDPHFSAAPMNAFLTRLEASPRPVVAALHGTVLGGGLELALTCHARIAHPATRAGFPEVNLGLIPGSLGTQRTPRLIGLAAAARLISGGKSVKADEALELGLFDALDADPGTAARAHARMLAAAKGRLRRASLLPIPDADQAEETLAALRATAAKFPHLPAHAAIAESLEAATRSYAEGAATEARAFAELVPSPVSRALRHVFFAEREARKIPGLPRDTARRGIEHVGILGVGTMGAGIAMAFANAGLRVTVVEPTAPGLERGMGIITRTWEQSVARGRMSGAQLAETRARLIGATDTAALAEADLVIEAVFEDMAVKLEVAGLLGRICRPGAIIASNTSTLDLDRIAAATGRARDVIGMHFFSPAHIMRLLEVVRGRETSSEVLATVMDLAARIGKVPVVSGVCYGFIGNRMAEVYMRESEAMQLEGATPAEIDGVAEDAGWIGMAMGPSRMLDMAGVDVGARTVIEWIKSGEGPQEPAYRALCRAMFEAGLHGQKTGEGYYRYEGRDRHPSERRAALAAELAERHAVPPRAPLEAEEIRARLLYPMINEAALILSEGIAFRPGDIDTVWTAGYGFPAWRGGPLFMADEIGLPAIVARMDELAARPVARPQDWQVAPLLRRLAAEGRRISDWTPSEEASS